MATEPMTFGLVSNGKKKKSNLLPKGRAGDYNVTDPLTKDTYFFYSLSEALEFGYKIIMNNQGYRYHYERNLNIRNKRKVIGVMHNSKWGPVFYDQKNDRYSTSIGHLVSPNGFLKD